MKTRGCEVSMSDITIGKRIELLDCYIEQICDETSTNAKKMIIDNMSPIVKDDFYYILEILDGQHKLGYTFDYQPASLFGITYGDRICKRQTNNLTFKEFIQPLYNPMKRNNFSLDYISMCSFYCQEFGDFIEPIVNRKLRLGIGKSLLKTASTAPMLAKKYEGTIAKDDAYFITEKLDGNRCIAQFDGEKWTFTSRNGKPMHVDFDMSGLDPNFTYDGEILSNEQTRASIKRAQGVYNKLYPDQFNRTSGLINSHAKNKALVYNIFDVQECWTQYKDRRAVLDSMTPDGDNVRILPVLMKYDKHIDQGVYNLLDDIVKSGGEGLMINTASGLYVPKRTNDLLKLKQVQTMDMEVIDTEYGSGKYEFGVGNLICEAILPNGSKITCSVGTGLSDEQRFKWAMYPQLILGKIVEIAYFSLSQSKDTIGTTTYSLRFPRLKQVRRDKNETSTY